MNEHKRLCGNCEWFEPMAGQAQGIGSCVFNPPVVVPMAVPQQTFNPKSLVNPGAPQTQMQMQTQIQGVQPPTHASRRCGQWSLNPELKGNGHTIRLPAAGTFGASG